MLQADTREPRLLNDETPADSSDSSVPTSGVVERELSRGVSVGRYVILEKLGHGGMGVVYAAFDPELDRKVALKLLRPDRGGASADRRTRLLKEARTLAKLSHENVVTVHGVETFLDQVCIAMEFIGGGTLTDWLNDEKPAWPEVVRVFLEAGEGLYAAHASGLVHRDFKPDNVLLDDKARPHVTDFGLAYAGDEAEAVAGHAAGTPGFMAPEQARREKVDARADQFSFCAALHLALYGTMPFPKGLNANLPLPLLPAAPPGTRVPQWVRRVVFKGLAEDPNARFGSMAEVLAALRADPAKRTRARLLTAVSVASVLALVALVAVVAGRETDDERAVRLCAERAQGESAAAWGPSRRAEVGAAFAGLKGEVALTEVSHRLDREVTAWTAASLEACRLPASNPERRRWTACLDERRKTLQSTSDMFAAADRGVVDNAVNTMMLEVQPVESCRATAATGPDLVTPNQVDESLRSGLARARVLKAAGKYADAIRAATAVAVEAEEPDPKTPQAPRVAAEARLLMGELYAELRRVDAEANLRRAITFGEALGLDEVRARASMALIAWYSDRDRIEEARKASDQANAILHRLGRPPLLEAARLNQEGQLATRLGDQGAAVDAFRAAVDLRRQHLPPEHPLLARSLTNLGLALPPAEGLPMLELVLATRLKLFGEQHPESANALHNVGLARLKNGECDRALEFLGRALKVRLDSPGADLARLGNEYTSQARAQQCAGQPDEALQSQRLGVKALQDGNAIEAEQLAELKSLERMLVALNHPVVEQQQVAEQIRALAAE